ncbi:hypothetical protein I3900191A7_25020 [Clostridium baratii]|uniref:glycosyltransferase family 2 protein n=1 Tax=Clostridium baratii TaxID=1561 RepID=UPI001C01E590|nr:glycosyltransferase [Clostridium baratii]MBT9830469.1 glycosyltransferase [Clostridium baratii]MDY3207554.1 glycosyltransferase [Clostridium baratii]
MIDNIKISIIIPVYNSEKFLNNTIESIIKQNLKNVELILINDCSTDSSGNICEFYKRNFKWIKYIELKENKGVGHARNIGLDMATGDYIHFIDSDDTLVENSYDKLFRNLNNNKIDLVTTGSNIIENNKIIEIRNIDENIFLNNINEIGKYLDNFELKDKDRVLNVIWNKLYSTDIIKRNNLRFDEEINLGEDFIFNCNYFKYINTFMESNICMYNYYKRYTGNLTTKFRLDVLSRRKRIYKEWTDLYNYYNLLNCDKKRKFEKIEGFLMYHSLYTIFSKNCNLNQKEKKQFLDEMIADEHINFVLKYKEKGIEYKYIKNKNINKLYNYMKIKISIKKIINKFI